MTHRMSVPLLVIGLVGCGSPCDEVLTLVPEPVVGGILYANNCRTCHGPAGEGDEGPALPQRVPFLSRCEIAEQVLAGGDAMPAFDDTLTAQEIGDITEFVFLEFQ